MGVCEAAMVAVQCGVAKNGKLWQDRAEEGKAQGGAGAYEYPVLPARLDPLVADPVPRRSGYWLGRGRETGDHPVPPAFGPTGAAESLRQRRKNVGTLLGRPRANGGVQLPLGNVE